MADRDALRVQPEVMQTASQALASASRDLHAKLADLDGQVREMLSGWQGGSGSAYGDAWNLWHNGAAEVQLGLTTLAKAVGIAGSQFEAQDAAAQQTAEGIYRG
ncbi:WXG100 family type VII secretion target [Mycobacterium sp.]|uniref:WXG100 family type VII secretion target n=1 Tax=Mycobacterium sp. TaxID=1785 RepID=UPI003D1179F9